MRRLGFNTLGISKVLHEDMWGTFKTLADHGYELVELLTDWGAKPEVIEHYKQLSGGISTGWTADEIEQRLPRLREMGLNIRSMFIFTDLIREQMPDMIAFCKRTGIDILIISFLDIGRQSEKCFEYVDLINEISPPLRENGITLCVHNHEIDFVLVEDRQGEHRTILDILLTECQQSGLMLELDTGWAAYADQDPAQLVRQYADQLKIIHIKDINKNFKQMPRDKSFVAAGDGVCDFKAIFQAVKEVGKDDILVIVDQDSSQADILEDQIKTAAHLKPLLENQ